MPPDRAQEPRRPKRQRRNFDRIALTRIVYQYNHGNQREALEWAWDAGYGTRALAREGYDETFFWRDGRLQGCMHSFHDANAEAFLFLFTPEATATRWDRFCWRLRHPLRPLAELPWPNREEALGA